MRVTSCSPSPSNDMLAGVRGRLITATFARSHLPTLDGFAVPPASVIRSLAAWAERLDAAAGPASSIRTIVDALVVPLLKTLGYED